MTYSIELLGSSLPSVIIIYGDARLDLLDFANRWAKSILCFKDKINAPLFYTCNECKNCKLLASNSYPYLYNLDARETGVDDIHELLDNIYYVDDNYKIIIVNDLAYLSPSASNALLKTLEEPPQNTIFLLISYNISSVMPTILSRAHRVFVPTADDNISSSSDYKNASTVMHDTLLYPSVNNIYSTLDCIQRQNIPFTALLNCLLDWILDLSSSTLCHKQLTVNKEVNMVKLFSLYDEIIRLTPFANHSLNYQLQISNLLFTYQGIFN